MSFYTYFGKVKDELFVAVLPSGTVQPQDTIYTYTSQKFSTYTARTVTNTDDGDKFTFKDETTSFEGVSKNGYKQIHLTIKTAAGNSKAELTRQYDQPSSGKHLSNHPKIWTGSFNFHQWAKNEPFVIVAPKGLGVGRPVISNWQWTKDDKGVPNTLSTCTSVQEADGDNSGTSKFYYKQNDYYTVECLMDNAGGLKVLVKSPSNPEQAQSLLTLSAKIELGDSHRLTPPKGAQEKISFDCSLPQDQPSLKRITRPLPFPSDLVETLSFSAAYVDQAGHLARYAVSQFDKLNASYHELEARLDSRAQQVTGLKKEVLDLRAETHDLKEQNHKLEANLEASERLLQQVRADAAKREAELLKQLQDTQAELNKTAGELRKAQAENKRLVKEIDEDKIRDIIRDVENALQDEADRKKIESLERALEAEKKTSHGLRGKIAEKDRRITVLETDLAVEKNKVSKANRRIKDLEIQLAFETKEKEALKESLKKMTEARDQAIKERDQATKNHREAVIQRDQAIKERDTALSELKESRSELDAAKKAIVKKDAEITDKTNKLTLAGERIKSKEKDCDLAEQALDQAEKDLKAAQAENERLTKEVEAKKDTKIGTVVTAREVPAGF